MFGLLGDFRAAQKHGRGGDDVAGEAPGGGRGRVRDDEAAVRALARGAETGFVRGGAETLRRAHATLDDAVLAGGEELGRHRRVRELELKRVVIDVALESRRPNAPTTAVHEPKTSGARDDAAAVVRHEPPR